MSCISWSLFAGFPCLGDPSAPGRASWEAKPVLARPLPFLTPIPAYRPRSLGGALIAFLLVEMRRKPPSDSVGTRIGPEHGLTIRTTTDKLKRQE